MPVANIVDKRINNKDVVCEVIAEPSVHDNSCKGATQFEHGFETFAYKETAKTTLAEAIILYASYDFPITLYLYDLDTNCGEVARAKMAAKKNT